MNIKNYYKLYYVLGVIYLLLVLPGILLFYGGIFLFYDPTMDSVLANMLFLVSSTFSLVSLFPGVVCFLQKKSLELVGDLWFKILISLPLIEILIFAIVAFITFTYCGGDFCI